MAAKRPGVTFTINADRPRPPEPVTIDEAFRRLGVDNPTPEQRAVAESVADSWRVDVADAEPSGELIRSVAEFTRKFGWATLNPAGKGNRVHDQITRDHQEVDVPAPNNPYRERVREAGMDAGRIITDRARVIANAQGVEERDVTGPGLSGQHLHTILRDAHTDGYELAAKRGRREVLDVEARYEDAQAGIYDDAYDIGVKRANEYLATQIKHVTRRAQAILSHVERTRSDEVRKTKLFELVRALGEVDDICKAAIDDASSTS